MAQTEARRQLQADYRQQNDRAGIFRVHDRVNQRCWLGASKDVAGALNRLRFELKLGKQRVSTLQHDYTKHGYAAFDFEILERILQQDRPDWNLDEELKLALSLWHAESAKTMLSHLL